jgi:hypothetical protein
MAIRGRRVRSEGRHDDAGAGDTGGFKNAPAAGVAEHDMVAEPLAARNRTTSDSIATNRSPAASRTTATRRPTRRGGRFAAQQPIDLNE